MNIFHKVTLQSMKISRTRTIVTVIGVALSAAMITAVATFAVSLLDYMVNGSIVKYGGWHIAFEGIDTSFVQRQIQDDRTQSTATIEHIGYALLDGGQNPQKPYLFIAGFSEDTFDTLPVSLLSGRLPENSEEIVIPAHVAANGGVDYKVGDTLSLAVVSRRGGSGNLGQHNPYAADQPVTARETLVPLAEKAYTVVGICERPAFEEYSAPGYTCITIADPAGSADSYSIFVTLVNPGKVRAYAKDTSVDHSYILNDNVLRFMGLSDDTVFNVLLYTVGGILVALIMLGSVFLIYNAFTISLNERIRQFGILSSVGATERQLRNSVLFEGLCIGAVGIPIGVLVGIGSIALVIPIVAGHFEAFAYNTAPLTLSVSVPAIVAAAAVSMVTILISAYIPARKAARLPVMVSIRQTSALKIQSETVRTSGLAERICGLEGTLALKNFKRNRKRYHSIVLSLALSVVLFVSSDAFATNLKQGAERSVVAADYDIVFTTQDMEETELFQLYNTLQTASGVYGSSYQAMITYICDVSANDFSELYREEAGYAMSDEPVNLQLDIQLIEDSIYMDFIESLGLPIEEYSGQGAKMIAVAKSKPDATQGELIDLFKGPSMMLRASPETDNGLAAQGVDINITFVDTFPLDVLPRTLTQVRPYIFMVIAPYHQKEYLASSAAQQELGLTFLSDAPAQSAAEMEDMIQEAGITSAYTLYNVHKIMEENRNILFVVNVFTSIFVIMISLIAVANVFNTISTNIKLRRRELAMLRSVGMSDRDFNRMMRFECAFYGMRALLFGLPVAAILSWLIYKGLVNGGADISFTFPWGSMVASTFSVFFVVFVTMLYAVHKIKKENIIDALRDDMT